MTKKDAARRWKVLSTAYFGTPGVEDAKNKAERKKYALEGGSKTALGDRVGRGDIAVPSNVPLGTVLYVPGYGWGVARDHGGGIKGNRIDVATGGVVGGKINPQAEKDAKTWGRKDQTVYVFPKGYQIPADRSPPAEYVNDTKNAPATSTSSSGKKPVVNPVQAKPQPRPIAQAPVEMPVPPPTPMAVPTPVASTPLISGPQSTISQQVAADALAKQESQPLVATSMNTLSPFVQMMREADLSKKLSANFPSYNQRVG